MDQNVSVPVMNRAIIESLERGEVKKAADATTGMTRIQLREGSFAFKVLPPEQATNDMLVPSLVHDKPMIYWELEPDSPGAKWVPFQTVPKGEYIWGSRYVVPLARVVTPKYEKDLDELRTYKTDLRKVLTDNSIKDGLAEIDGKFISLCDAIVTDTADTTPNTVQNFTGKYQWQVYAGGLTRENFAEAKKMMLRGSTYTGMTDKFHLRNHIALMNEVTAQELLKMRRDHAGGDISETMLQDGLTMEKYFGVKLLYTIKSGLVPTGTIYFFAAPEFLGKSFYLTDWTMYMKKEAYMIEMFSYWLGGMAIGNVAGVCRADFTGIE